jgi:hypothetical protein
MVEAKHHRVAEHCGALDDRMNEARAIVENVWAVAAQLVADSDDDAPRLRWYVLERYY